MEESDAEDDRLLARGDLDVLFARHYDDLVARARMRVGADRAGDVVQSALMRTLREIQSGREWPLPFRAVVHQHLRWEIASLAGGDPPALLPPGWDIADPAGHDALDAVEERLSLLAVLEALPPGDRRIMTRRYIDGREIDAIAHDLDMTRNAVDQALWRGRRALRDAWNA